VKGQQGNQFDGDRGGKNNIALLVGSDWRSFADFAISTSLVNSYRVVNQVNNTTMYKGIAQIKNSRARSWPRITLWLCALCRTAG
jgi:hypothetical protein